MKKESRVVKVWNIQKQRDFKTGTEYAYSIEIGGNYQTEWVKIAKNSSAQLGYWQDEKLLPWLIGSIVKVICHRTAKGNVIVDRAEAVNKQ